MLGSEFPAGAERTEVATDRGPVALLDAGGYLVLQRHGLDAYRAPHAIDHRANLLALAGRGVDRVLAVCSTGALHREIEVGSLLAPHDFVAPELGMSFYDDARGHVIPGLDGEFRADVLAAWNPNAPALADGGVYRQVPGPRFETASEVRLFSQQADVIGMTMASECVLACELGIRYAAICTVDNHANGIGREPLSREEFEAGVAATRSVLFPELAGLVARLS
jgi:5'-methylthioadenosine phosphorylase